MGAFSSDLDEAKQSATNLKNSITGLQQGATVSLDTKTTVSGNVKAQECIKIAQETATQLATVVSDASKSIFSVATEFQAMEDGLAKTLFGGNLLSKGEYWE